MTAALDYHELLAPESCVVTSGFDGATAVPLLHPAWAVLDMVSWSVPPKVVENRPNLGGIGSTPLDSAVNQLSASNRIHIIGAFDPDGEPTTVAHDAQFRRNWLYLCRHLFMPKPALSAVYTSPDPDEAPISFLIQFGTPSLDPSNGMWPTDWIGQVQVVLPDGPLVPA